MVKKKVSVRKLKSFAREEKEASREYKRLGFKSQAKDEHKHHEYFEKELERRKIRMVKKKGKKKSRK